MQPGKKLVIGLFGFGVVGEGLYQVIHQDHSLEISIKRVCIKHPEKSRNAPVSLFTADKWELLNDEEINVIVELTNDPEAAYEIVQAAFEKGKAVVSANKAMIAAHLEILIRLQRKSNLPFLYEAAACASIPVIRNLEEYYDNDLLQGISGVVNGSTNYMLTKMSEEELDFRSALKRAQSEGFAESDPTLDINGSDAANKLSILLTHGYGLIVPPDELLYAGIQNIRQQDAIYAREKGMEIKLVAHACKTSDERIAAFILPQFVRAHHLLYHVKNEYNGVIIESSLADQQFFYGKGAGAFPTASAVLSDLSALRYDYKYEYKKLRQSPGVEATREFLLRVYVSFEKLFQVPHDAFEQIWEWGSNEERCHVIGVIRGSVLKQSDWWRKDNTSLILLPEPFAINEQAIHKHRSEMLSGIFI